MRARSRLAQHAGEQCLGSLSPQHATLRSVPAIPDSCRVSASPYLRHGSTPAERGSGSASWCCCPYASCPVFLTQAPRPAAAALPQQDIFRTLQERGCLVEQTMEQLYSEPLGKFLADR